MNLCVQRYLGTSIFAILSHWRVVSIYYTVSLLMFDVVFAQVEEAVAVLQAHQAKKDATQKVGSMATAAATATSWRQHAVLNRYDNT